MNLPTDKAKTVEAYIQWLYTGSVYSKMPETGKQAQYAYLAELYGFAEKVLDEKL